MPTNISIKGKAQNGDSNTTTINYVNPAATNEQLMSLATAFNDFTTNTITDVTRIDKSSLTSDSRSSRNLRVINGDTEQPITAIPSASIGVGASNAFGVIVQMDGMTTDLEAYVKFTFTSSSSSVDHAPIQTEIEIVEPNEFDCYLYKREDKPLNVSALTVYIPATDLYQAATVTLPIT